MHASLPYDEKDLLARVAAGDEAAFSRLFRQWNQLLAGYVYRITESTELTEEIVQDVFMKIWMVRESMTGVQNFKHFLLVVSRNRAFDAMRRQLRERRRAAAMGRMRVVQEEQSERDDFCLSLIEQAIESLSPRRKEVFMLSRGERLSYQEIGVRLGISKESVKTHLKLASVSINGFVRSRLPALGMAVGLIVQFF